MGEEEEEKRIGDGEKEEDDGRMERDVVGEEEEVDA